MTLVARGIRPYDQLTEDEQYAVDYAYGQLTEALKLHGVKIANDDRAENVVDGIATGILETKND
jgi:hypothetical protein